MSRKGLRKEIGSREYDLLFATPTAKIIEEACAFSDSFSSQVNSRNSKIFYEGVTALGKTFLLQVSRERIIVGDTLHRELLKVNDEDVSGIEHGHVLDLNNDGERWEGDVLRNEPYGWGVLYDKENYVRFEGFRIGGVSVCYGRSYYSDIHQVEYEGGICEGKRWGMGIHYDRMGTVLFEGEWLNDGHAFEKRVVITEENQQIHNYIEELTVSDNCCNGEEWTALDLRVLHKLKSIKIGDHCFKHVEHTRITDLPALRCFTTGVYCFTNKMEGQRHDYFRSFVLTNCPHLRSVEVGSCSFFGCTTCELEKLPSLQKASIGDFCFCFCSLELRDMPELASLFCGCYAFCYCCRFVLENLPVLASVELKNNAFVFCLNGFENKLVLRDLPALSSLRLDPESESFQNAGSFIAENLPSLSHVVLSPWSFQNNCTLHIQNADALNKTLQAYPFHQDRS